MSSGERAGREACVPEKNRYRIMSPDIRRMPARYGSDICSLAMLRCAKPGGGGTNRVLVELVELPGSGGKRILSRTEAIGRGDANLVDSAWQARQQPPILRLQVEGSIARG